MILGAVRCTKMGIELVLDLQTASLDCWKSIRECCLIHESTLPLFQCIYRADACLPHLRWHVWYLGETRYSPQDIRFSTTLYWFQQPMKSWVFQFKNDSALTPMKKCYSWLGSQKTGSKTMNAEILPELASASSNTSLNFKVEIISLDSQEKIFFSWAQRGRA